LVDIIDTLKGMKIADIDDKEKIESLFEDIYKFFENPFEQDDDEPEELKFDDIVIKATIQIKFFLKLFRKINFKKFFPNSDYKIILPELQIDDNGYANFNIDEVFSGFNFDHEFYKENYPEIYNSNELMEIILYSNENFKIFDILDKIDELMMINNINEKVFLNDLGNLLTSTMITGDSYREEMGKTEENQAFFDGSLTEFKTKNATMTFELNRTKKSFKKVTFSLSGQYSRYFPKPNYNIKIRDDKELYGRSQFKLRSDSIEPTYLRTKLVSDIHNRLGLKSSSANYIQLYINDEYMGLYIITDNIKLSWVEKEYGDKESTTLYKCKNIRDLLPKYSKGCINENDKVTDNTEWNDFLKAVQNAKSASDLEDIFEIDHFLYEMAIEFLVSGWDHIQNTHNFNLYKQPNGKWIYLSYDFDLDIGQYYEHSYELAFNEFSYKLHIIDILILQDSSRFDNILKDVINRVFNPSILFPHIDELKKFIKPYVELDKISDSNGRYPGRINESRNSFYTIEQWDAYSEFTTGFSDRVAYGLKYWILMEYRNICNKYDMDCDPTYMDENYYYPINKNVEFKYIYDDYSTYEYETEIPTQISYEHPTATERPTEYITFDDTEEEDVYDVEIDLPTNSTDDDEESSDDDEDTTESVESSVTLLTIHILNI
jgi:hypothetical protein